MKIFLSGPLTQYLAARTSAQTEDFAAVWVRITTALRLSGHDVFSAHEREGWGTKLKTPAEALTADLEGLRQSDLVIAYVGVPSSPGVQLEIGYALALELPLVIFIDRGQAEPYLVRGIPAVAQAEVVEIDSIREIVDALVDRGIATVEPVHGLASQD